MRLERDARGTAGAPVGDEEPDAGGGHCGWSARARKGCPRARRRDMIPPRERTACFVEVPAVSAGLLGLSIPPSRRASSEFAKYGPVALSLRAWRCRAASPHETHDTPADSIRHERDMTNRPTISPRAL